MVILSPSGTTQMTPPCHVGHAHRSGPDTLLEVGHLCRQFLCTLIDPSERRDMSAQDLGNRRQRVCPLERQLITRRLGRELVHFLDHL